VRHVFLHTNLTSTQSFSFEFRAGKEVGHAHPSPEFVASERSKNYELDEGVGNPIEVESDGESHPDGYGDNWQNVHVLAHVAEQTGRAVHGRVHQIDQVDAASHERQNSIWVRHGQVFEPEEAVSEHGGVDLRVVGQSVDHLHKTEVQGQLGEIQCLQYWVDSVCLLQLLHLSPFQFRRLSVSILLVSLHRRPNLFLVWPQKFEFGSRLLL